MGVMPLAFERDETGPTAGVVTVFLEQEGRPVVVLNRDILERLDATLDAIGAPETGFVLASRAPKAFVAGADLKEIDGLSDDELDDYLAFGQRVFGRIAALPCHSVAAINGAALGGGLELAMHCDTLIAAMPRGTEDKPARPYPVGLPEAGLHICPGWGGTNMLPARMNPAAAIEMTAKGEPMTVIEAREAGLITQLLDNPDDLLPLAKERAARPAPKSFSKAKGEPRNISLASVREDARAGLRRATQSLPKTKAAAAVVEAVETGLHEGWGAALDAERRLLTGLRNTDEAKQAIGAFFAKSKA